MDDLELGPWNPTQQALQMIFLGKLKLRNLALDRQGFVRVSISPLGSYLGS